MALDLQVTLGVTVAIWTAGRGGASRGSVLRPAAGLPVRWAVTASDIRRPAPRSGGVTFKTVDTCGAEFESSTPYHYSTSRTRTRSSRPPAEGGHPGSGPNRIGQGIEFDYCCVHASFALQEAGYETVMVNCNPETVSTDYDTSDRLYFEP